MQKGLALNCFVKLVCFLYYIVTTEFHCPHDCSGCVLIKQSFFYGNQANFVDLGGGVTGCRGIHTSFRTTGAGLSLNIGVTHTLALSVRTHIIN